MTGGNAPGGWDSPYAFPLLVSRETKAKVFLFMANKNLSEGKAYNELIREGLAALGYLERPKTPEQLHVEASKREADWVRSHWAEMSPKAREYWGKRYPT